jgi:hypothetical protein
MAAAVARPGAWLRRVWPHSRRLALRWWMGASVVLIAASSAGALATYLRLADRARFVHERAVPAVIAVAAAGRTLAEADRAATQSFSSEAARLAGPPEEYRNGVSVTSEHLTLAAEANVAGAESRRDINGVQSLLAAYTGSVEQASAGFSRERDALAVVDLWTATRLLHAPGEAFESLRDLQARQARALDDAAGSGGAGTVLPWLVPGILLIGVLFALQVWLAAGFRRVFNPLLLGATFGVLVGLYVFAGHVTRVEAGLGAARDEALAIVTAQEGSTAAAVRDSRFGLHAVLMAVCDPPTRCGATVSTWSAEPPPGEPGGARAPLTRPSVDAGMQVVAEAERDDLAYLVPLGTIAALALVVVGMSPRFAEYRFTS